MIYRCCSIIDGLSGSFAVNLASGLSKNTTGKIEGSLQTEQADEVCFGICGHLNEMFPDCHKKTI